MLGRPELDVRLDDLRNALAQGMTHMVGGLVKAALIAGCTKQQLLHTAGYVGSGAGMEAVRRAVEAWSWIEARRQCVEREIDGDPGVSANDTPPVTMMSFDGGSVTIRCPLR